MLAVQELHAWCKQAQRWPVKLSRRVLCNFLISLSGVTFPSHGAAQDRSDSLPRKRDESKAVSALLVSDIHFDPFQDPHKAKQLARSPITAWDAILSGPPSNNQEAEFAEVRRRCGPTIFDTSSGLLRATLAAIRARAPEIAFATLTGDLIAHDFACRYDAVLPGRSKADADRFTEKTILYVIQSVRRALHGKPVYVALGNNDTLCGDYRLDEHDKLFKALAGVVSAAASKPQSETIKRAFVAGGHFSTLLPAPLCGTKIVVLDDLPFSSRFKTCAGSRAPQIADAQSAWLRTELDSARRDKQKVWVIAHIPPGIDARASLFGRDLCATRDPVVFLSSDRLASTLVEYADVIKMAVFAHTHMDEFRLLRANTGHIDVQRPPSIGVPLKLVPSISPVAGNRPSFTIATISITSSEMEDYTVYAASESKGNGTTWQAEYSLRKTYGLPSLSASSLDTVIRRLEEDVAGSSDDAKEYIRLYTLGSGQYGIQPVWSQYRCLQAHAATSDFLKCACPSSQAQ